MAVGPTLKITEVAIGKLGAVTKACNLPSRAITTPHVVVALEKHPHGTKRCGDGVETNRLDFILAQVNHQFDNSHLLMG